MLFPFRLFLVSQIYQCFFYVGICRSRRIQSAGRILKDRLYFFSMLFPCPIIPTGYIFTVQQNLTRSGFFKPNQQPCKCTLSTLNSKNIPLSETEIDVLKCIKISKIFIMIHLIYILDYNFSHFHSPRLSL